MSKPIAIDLFCGAGGMSEGIIQAGFHIVFSSDKSEEASLTYKNRHTQLGLIHGKNTYFETMDIKDLSGSFIQENINTLEDITFHNKEIDAIFGGPPCQGFSRAGQRKEGDPRNFLFREYLRVVSDIMPKYVIMENVVGLLDTKLKNFINFSGYIYEGVHNITKILENEFTSLGYTIKNYGLNKDGSINFKKLVLDSREFGIPQKRQRVIIVAYRNDVIEPEDINHFKSSCRPTIKEALADLILDSSIKSATLNELRNDQKLNYILESNLGRTPNLITNEPVSNIEAYGDNIQKNTDLSSHYDYIKERFSLYNQGETTKNAKERFSKLHRINYSNFPNLLSHSFSALRKEFSTIEELKFSLDNFESQNDEIKELIIETIFTKKNIRVKLNMNDSCNTVVTLPDDYISPFEQRTFSVRELARLQSFDDSFEFLGKRTTGGSMRKLETPQYTQVGNAVPPLLAKGIAKSIISVLRR